MNLLFSKKTYFIIGFLATIVGTIVFENLLLGIATGFIIGVAKEIKDKMLYEFFDLKDMLVTWLGSLSAIVIMYLCIVLTFINFG